MWDGINRRKFPRANYACRIHIRQKAVPQTIITQTENIGAGGICVMIERDLGLFQDVELELDLDDNMPAIKCLGTVVWVVKKRAAGDSGLAYDTGIEFAKISEKDITRILSVVEDILKKGGTAA
ncbi:MAG: PilZ domain-containing protein [Candidatus Omnitrophota bacterium]